LLYIAASVEQYCDITQVNALPENEGILEAEPGKAGQTCTVVTDLLAWPDKEIRHEHGTGTHSIAGMLGGTPFSQRDRALEKPWESSRSPERTTRPTAPGRK
jgi:hypothetical protein